MNMRERMLALIRGEELDRVPFVQYTLSRAFDEEVWGVLGRDNMGILEWQTVHRWEHPNCRFEDEPAEFNGRPGVRRTLHTPAGSLVEERVIQPTYSVEGFRKHFVEETKDYEVLLAFFRDLVLFDAYDELRQVTARVGDDGLPHAFLESSPYQQLWSRWTSLMDLPLHMADAPDLVEEVIAVMSANMRKIFQLVAKAPIPYVVMPDNITAPVIGEARFRKYCLPLYQELAGICEESGILFTGHLDGDLKPLWKAIGESGLKGIDSLSPPPDNDTSPADVVAMWPEMRMLLNFPSSVHLRSPEAIYQRAMEILEEAGHSGRLQIQISENVPPGVWRKSYPEIVRAIRDFGKP